MDVVDQRRIEARVIRGTDHALIGELATQDQALQLVAQRPRGFEPVPHDRERLSQAGANLLVDLMAGVLTAVVGVAGNSSLQLLEVGHPAGYVALQPNTPV